MTRVRSGKEENDTHTKKDFLPDKLGVSLAVAVGFLKNNPSKWEADPKVDGRVR